MSSPPTRSAADEATALLSTPEGRSRLAAALARYLWEQEQEQRRLDALRRIKR